MSINPNVLKPKAVGIESLSLDPRNARMHSERNIEAIMASLRAFGQQKPIVAREGVVIAGNGTLEAARRLGWATIAVVDFDGQDEAAAKAYALADNRTAELAEWDTDRLAQMRNEIAPFELEQVGWTEDEFQEMFPPDRERSEDLLRRLNVSIGPPTALVERHEVYRLGNHVLVCASPHTEHQLFVRFLVPGTLFLPYPGPYFTISERAKFQKLLLVQPDPVMCGYIIDTHKEAFGPDSVERE